MLSRVLVGGAIACGAVAGSAGGANADGHAGGHTHDHTAWVDLFDGESLDGWVVSGNADAWDVEGGHIVITGAGGGGWLRTDRMYRDFELLVDFWMPEDGNSGIGLRGSSGGDPAFTGFEIQMLDSHGEDPGVRNCGAVYEAIAPASMAVNPAGEWNTYRVRLVDDVLEVWLNGDKIHDREKLDGRGFFRAESSPLPLDARATTGYIALQDHGHQFRFRNIKIRDLSPDPEPSGMTALLSEWLPLWFQEDAGEWAFSPGTGAMTGRGGPGHLFTKETYTDFELRGLVKISERGNSGVYFRVTPNPDPNNPWPNGYEAQVDNHDPGNYTGCVYNMAWPEHISGPITRDEAWFDYRVRVEGERVRTWVNGVPMVDCFREDFDEGHLAVQGHHDGNVVMYKDLRVLDLSE